ncbi:hypothetical protein [Acinetobacter bereziniae]|uniref:hypothetical protein n=1 Tax=Acinetobacter bereziniae TaxID=106648 RepID=UPI0019013726|nr:hypothetical protein [Acinetobacter bereziniae]MBJ8445881.1 hypothetical protein [Acinetobacter bereziniae]
MSKAKGQQRSAFIKSAIQNGGQAIFYLLKCTSQDESFYKLGISVNHILTRYGSPKAMPYEWTIVLEYPDTPESIYDLESSFKGQMEQYHYTPSIPFNGSKTECYSNLTEELQNLVFEVNN